MQVVHIIEGVSQRLERSAVLEARRGSLALVRVWASGCREKAIVVDESMAQWLLKRVARWSLPRSRPNPWVFYTLSALSSIPATPFTLRVHHSEFS